MLKAFIPTWQLTSIYDLTPEVLAQHHIQCILTDLDNTLVPWDYKEKTEQLSRWLATMKEAGIHVIIVSNNNEERVSRVAQALGIDYVARAKKPLTSGIKKALAKSHCSYENTVMIGDQVMTDICAANHAHVRSILVKPLATNDAWNTKINRWLEKCVKKQLSCRVTWKWEDTLK